jgi:hypothetical protein
MTMEDEIREWDRQQRRLLMFAVAAGVIAVLLLVVVVQWATARHERDAGLHPIMLLDWPEPMRVVRAEPPPIVFDPAGTPDFWRFIERKWPKAPNGRPTTVPILTPPEREPKPKPPPPNWHPW